MSRAGDDRRDLGPERIGVLLGGFLERKGVRVQLERTGVLEAWPAKVGEAIAQVTRARGLSEGTLFVEVVSSAWLMELNMMRGEILQRVNEGREDALIERIVFVQGEAPRGA